MFGAIEIDGVRYIERVQSFPVDVNVTVGLSVLLNQRVVLPGVAPFLLKSLTRETIAANVIAARRFRFKFGNTDGGVYYTAAGVGGANDRVVDTLIFGNGQFPYLLVPPVFYSSSANILFEFEDLSNVVPYTTHITFHGSYLIPA